LKFYHPKNQKKKKKSNHRKEKKKKKKKKKTNKHTAGETQPWALLAGRRLATRWVDLLQGGRSSFQQDPTETLNHRKEKKKKKCLRDPRPARPNGGSRWPAWMVCSAPWVSSFFLLLLFSFFFSHPISYCRMYFVFFFFGAFFSGLCEVSASKWWAKNPAFLPQPN
jgi:hypothetical protein